MAMRPRELARRSIKLVIVALLLLELILIDGIGYMLSGALGEEDDAKGPILLTGPGSVLLSLLVVWRFGDRRSAWVLALAVLSGPFWGPMIFGPASQKNLWSFWAQLAVVITWPIWGLLPFQFGPKAADDEAPPA
jgi:hypothetical protein